MKRLKISGQPGQGVQLLGSVLAEVLNQNGYQVALTSKYSPLVRKGESEVFLVYSKQLIANPLVEKADLTYDLARYQSMVTPLNMHVLGIILKDLKLSLKPTQLKSILPPKNYSRNLKAIKAGFSE